MGFATQNQCDRTCQISFITWSGIGHAGPVTNDTALPHLRKSIGDVAFDNDRHSKQRTGRGSDDLRCERISGVAQTDDAIKSCRHRRSSECADVTRIV